MERKTPSINCLETHSKFFLLGTLLQNYSAEMSALYSYDFIRILIDTVRSILMNIISTINSTLLLLLSLQLARPTWLEAALPKPSKQRRRLITLKIGVKGCRVIGDFKDSRGTEIGGCQGIWVQDVSRTLRTSMR